MSITPNTSITDDGLVTGDIRGHRIHQQQKLAGASDACTFTWLPKTHMDMEEKVNKSNKTIKSFKTKREKEKLSYLDVETLERHISKFWNTKRN